MHLLASVLGLALAVPAGEEEKVRLPEGPPPTILVVSKVDADAGKVAFRRVETVFVPVQVTEYINVNGKAVPVTVLRLSQKLDVVVTPRESPPRPAAA